MKRYLCYLCALGIDSLHRTSVHSKYLLHEIICSKGLQPLICAYNTLQKYDCGIQDGFRSGRRWTTRIDLLEVLALLRHGCCFFFIETNNMPLKKGYFHSVNIGTIPRFITVKNPDIRDKPVDPKHFIIWHYVERGLGLISYNKK